MEAGDWWVALVGPVSAIVASTLTAYLAHRFEWRRRQIDENLRWLEERYRPALEFLGELVGMLSTVKAREDAERLSFLHRIQKYASHAWPCALRLDPEDTGLRDLLLETLTYAHIAQSEKDFREYAVRVLSNYQALNRTFLEERERVLSGTTLTALIRERTRRKQQERERFRRGMEAIQAYAEGRSPLEPTLRELERAGIRGELLRIVLELEKEAQKVAGDEKDRIENLQQVCRERGWL